MGESPENAPAVLINRGAGTVRRRPELIDRIRARLPARHVEVTASLDEVAPALESLASSETDTLFIVGGDGSITGTLTELLRVWPPDRLPRVAIAAGGTINTIARSLGARGRPDQMLIRYLAAPAPTHEELRPVLKVVADAEPPRNGMIFANGAAARWLESYYTGRSGSLAAAGLVARTLASVPLGGALARKLFEPYRARVELDGEVSEQTLTVAGGATVRHVGLGFAPFLTAGHNRDRFHWVWTDAPGSRLGREIPSFALGFYPKNSCLHHASPKRVGLELESPEPYTIDGDLFPKASRLSVEAGPLLRFIAP